MKNLIFVISLLYFTAILGQCPEGDVILIGQSDIDNFETLYPNCEAIEEFLIIQGNDVVDLSPLDNINSVGSILIDDTSLTSMQGLDALTITGLTNQDAFIVIDNNSMLQDVQFLSNYTVNVPIVFLIRDMSALTSLEGAENITEFITIYLDNNDALTSLADLSENLNIIGGLVQSPLLYIVDNANLSDISRLDTAQWNNALTAEINNNALLSVCENNLVCTLVENNLIAIQDNAPGCNSTIEVGAACENLAINTFEESTIRIYPNPVTDILVVSDLNEFDIKNISIYSSSGEKLKETNVSRIDLSDFASGIYFVKISTKNGMSTRLVIKK